VRYDSKMCAVYSNGEALTENYVETPQTCVEWSSSNHNKRAVCNDNQRWVFRVHTWHVSDVVT